MRNTRTKVEHYKRMKIYRASFSKEQPDIRAFLLWLFNTKHEPEKRR